MRNAVIVHGGIAIVELTQGQSMRAAEADLPMLAPYRWCAHRYRHTWYAATNARRPDGHRILLHAHRLLKGLDFGDPREVDHWDGNGLNNLPSNLHITNRAGNMHNEHGKKPRRRGETPTSSFPGVWWNRRASKWQAQIHLAGQGIHLGLFVVEENAVEAYRRAKAIRDAGGTEAKIRATRSHPRSDRTGTHIDPGQPSA